MTPDEIGVLGLVGSFIGCGIVALTGTDLRGNVGYKPRKPEPPKVVVGVDYARIAELEHICNLIPHWDEAVRNSCSNCLDPRFRKDSMGRRLPVAPSGSGGGSQPNPIVASIYNRLAIHSPSSTKSKIEQIIEMSNCPPECNHNGYIQVGDIMTPNEARKLGYEWQKKHANSNSGITILPDADIIEEEYR